MSRLPLCALQRKSFVNRQQLALSPAPAAELRLRRRNAADDCNLAAAPGLFQDPSRPKPGGQECQRADLSLLRLPATPFLSHPPAVRSLTSPPSSPHLTVTFHPGSLRPRVLPPSPSLSPSFSSSLSLHPYFSITFQPHCHRSPSTLVSTDLKTLFLPVSFWPWKRGGRSCKSRVCRHERARSRETRAGGGKFAAAAGQFSWECPSRGSRCTASWEHAGGVGGGGESV